MYLIVIINFGIDIDNSNLNFRNYLIESTLEVLEQVLDSAAFYRISRKFIIPLKSIKGIVVYSSSRLKVILPSYKEDEVIVSREKVSDFKAWIG